MNVTVKGRRKEKGVKCMKIIKDRKPTAATWAWFAENMDVSVERVG
jgi:hypothetical protein